MMFLPSPHIFYAQNRTNKAKWRNNIKYLVLFNWLWTKYGCLLKNDLLINDNRWLSDNWLFFDHLFINDNNDIMIIIEIVLKSKEVKLQ